MYNVEDAPQFTFTVAPGAGLDAAGGGAAAQPTSNRGGAASASESAAPSAKPTSPSNRLRVAVAGRRAGRPARDTPLSPTARMLRRASMAATNEEKAQLKRQILDQHAAKHFAKLRRDSEESNNGGGGGGRGDDSGLSRRVARLRPSNSAGSDGGRQSSGGRMDFRHGPGALPRDDEMGPGACVA